MPLAFPFGIFFFHKIIMGRSSLLQIQHTSVAAQMFLLQCSGFKVWASLNAFSFFFISASFNKNPVASAKRISVNSVHLELPTQSCHFNFIYVEQILI